MHRVSVVAIQSQSYDSERETVTHFKVGSRLILVLDIKTE